MCCHQWMGFKTNCMFWGLSLYQRDRQSSGVLFKKDDLCKTMKSYRIQWSGPAEAIAGSFVKQHFAGLCERELVYTAIVTRMWYRPYKVHTKSYSVIVGPILCYLVMVKALDSNFSIWNSISSSTMASTVLHGRVDLGSHAEVRKGIMSFPSWLPLDCRLFGHGMALAMCFVRTKCNRAVVALDLIWSLKVTIRQVVLVAMGMCVKIIPSFTTRNQIQQSWALVGGL